MATLKKGGVPVTAQDQTDFKAAMNIVDLNAAAAITATKPVTVDADTFVMFDSANGGSPVEVNKGQFLSEVTTAIGDVETILASI